MRASGIITFKFQKSQIHKQLLNGESEHLLLAYHLMINGNSHMSGFYYYPVAYMAAETKRTEDDIERSIEVLDQLGFMQYDHNESFVWVVDMAYEQSGFHKESDSRRKSTINHIAGMPDLKIRDNFIEYYGVRSEIPAENHKGRTTGVTRGLNVPPTVTIPSNPILKGLGAKIPNPNKPQKTENLDLPGEDSNG